MKAKTRNSVLHDELKTKIVSLLSHEDEEVNLQAGELLLSLDAESITDFIHLIMFEFQSMLKENDRLMSENMRIRARRCQSEAHSDKTIPFGLDLSEIVWND